MPKKEFSKNFEKPFYLEKNVQKKPREVKDEDLDNKLEYLKKIIKMDFKEGFWSANNSKNKIELNDMGNYSIIKKRKKKEDKNKAKNIEDDIIIDGKKYNNENIRDIADIIFTKCGYYHKKHI